MIYHFSQVVLQRIYSTMVDYFSPGEDLYSRQEEAKNLKKLERKFERTFLTDLASCCIPRDIFRLSVPPFVNLEVRH